MQLTEFEEILTNLECAHIDVNMLFQQLTQAYSEPHRYYHTLQHINECWQWFQQFQSLAQYPTEVAYALCFHDIIYDTHKTDNEALSADLAINILQQNNISPSIQQRIHALIMATQHHQPITCDEKLLVDIDLAILGSNATRFHEYEMQVKQEYSWVPNIIYRYKRRQVLQKFYQRHPIYTTPEIQDLLEQPAKTNLSHSLKLTK